MMEMELTNPQWNRIEPLVTSSTLKKDGAAGRTSVEEASQALSQLSHEDISYAHIDHHRSLRTGLDF